MNEAIQEQTPAIVNKAIQEQVPKIIDERVPKIINEMVPKIIDERVPKIIDERVPELINDQNANAANDGIRDIVRFEIQSALRPIKAQLNRMEESLEETRTTANHLAGWADVVEHHVNVMV